MSGIDTGGGSACVEARATWGISASSFKFFYKPNTALKKKYSFENEKKSKIIFLNYNRSLFFFSCKTSSEVKRLDLERKFHSHQWPRLFLFSTLLA